MDGLDVVDVAREAIWVTTKVAGPFLVVALVIGFAISLIQALTQIQEMTLTFIPKLIGLLLTLFLLLNFLGNALQGFAHFLFDKIVMIEEKEADLRSLG